MARRNKNIPLPEPVLVDPVRTMLASGLKDIITARKMRQQARHYKNIRVGVIARGQTRDGRIITAAAANQNLQPGENPTKMCGERRALSKLQQQGLYRLLYMRTSGPPQPDTQSGLVAVTMLTCGVCRGACICSAEVSGTTIFDHIHPHIDGNEAYDLDELQIMNAAPVDMPKSQYNHDPGFKRLRQGLFDYDFAIANGLINPGDERPVVHYRQAIMGHLAIEDYARTA